MKKIITAFIFCFLCGECFSQAGEWVWIKGDSVPNQAGNYGVQGVPSPTNNPPSLYEPCEWTDLNGNFWMFGGLRAGNHGDLWKYDALLNEWTWMKGSGIVNDPGNYGVQGVPSSTNNPPARAWGVPSWVDAQNNLWIFGGSDGLDKRSDLWKYDISTNEWTWMKGPNTVNQAGIYGTMGLSDPANNPGARWECAAAWTDNANNIWLFGGCTNSGSLNDLWEFNINSDEWTWMKGSQFTNQAGVYGTQGVENVANNPSARWAYSHWKDSAGNFWFFGGHSANNYNDLWRFNPVTNNWAWMDGSSTGTTPGIFGSKCFEASDNIPPAKFENRASATDQKGNFWLFGGTMDLSAFSVWNDLWKYCLATHNWIWQGGDSTSNPTGNWGIINVQNPNNKLDGRSGAVMWSDNNNHLYIFGGDGHPFNNEHNDIWKFTIDSTCGICPSSTGIQENNFTNELLVFPNPTSSSLTISFSSFSKQTVELHIYNTLGKQIYFSKEEITKGKFEKEINVEKWSDGIYFLQVKMKKGNMNRKVIVSHP